MPSVKCIRSGRSRATASERTTSNFLRLAKLVFSTIGAPTLTTALLGRVGWVLSESEEPRPAGPPTEGDCPGDAIANCDGLGTKVGFESAAG